MTHYYYYIECGATVNSESTIYKVGVGTSDQAQRDYLFLTSHAVDAGHYFEIVSDTSTNFINRIQNSVFPYQVSIKAISARNLVRYFKGLGGMPLSPEQLHAAHSARFATDIDYRISCNFSAAGKNHLPSQTR